MDEKFIINGKKSLQGEVEIRGSKNAAGPALAAVLLTSDSCEIDNLPVISDILDTVDILKSIGAEVEWINERKVRLTCKSINPVKIDMEKVSKNRISVLLFGSLLGRVKKFKISSPGGDRIGLRPINVQLNALEKLGAKIKKAGDLYEVSCQKLKGAEIFLEEFSVTATETVMLAAVLAEGRTVINGAACEPHVEDLGNMLVKMGAKISGMGSHSIIIDGVRKLHGCSYKIISDPIEAGTFIVAGALTPGVVKIKNIDTGHLGSFLAKLKEIGVIFKASKKEVVVSYSPNLKAVKLQALPYPGFPTDLLPITVPLLVKAKGKSLIHDPLYENRFNYIQELRKMGGDIEIVDPHRAFVFGPKDLSGLFINSSDIRAGAALIIAGLSAKGKTTIKNISQIDRGYEKIEERLKKLGANIERHKE